MIARLRDLLDWLHERTGYRTGLSHLLYERLPRGTNWFFTLGSVLLALLAIQALTGIVLTLYYAPTPDHAWDSVNYITNGVTFGRLVRNLHFYGASFIVVAAALHLLRVFFFGSYKAPRELTWITGVTLLLIILAFSLTGYLLPWDQRAYWATVVTINIGRTAPFAGDFIASVLQGGAQLGALTLSRWYSAHVILLPIALLLLIVTHLFLMRRHEISGPLTPRPGEGEPFFPYHAVKDALMAGAVFVGLFVLAIVGGHQLEPVANPEDAAYVPRPEWYFLWLFQMLKYFPGRLEVIGAHVIPGLLVAMLLLLPFLDRSPERRPWRRPMVSLMAIVVMIAIGALTALGLADRPDNENRTWSTQALGGQLLFESNVCTRCHVQNGAAAPLNGIRLRRDDRWIASHAADPEVIAPGIRKPTGGLEEREAQAVVAYIAEVRRGSEPPVLDAHDGRALSLLGAYCLGCHVFRDEGTEVGPTITHAGKDRDAKWLTGWITNPVAYEFDTDMPAFGPKLPAEDIRLIAEFLAKQK